MAHKPRMTPDRWLYLLHQNLRPLFRDAGYAIPTNMEFRCGFTKGRADGQWFRGSKAKAPRPFTKITTTAPEHKDAAMPHYVFVSPTVDDPVAVGAIVVHELIHAVLPATAAHKWHFQEACRRLGLVMTRKNGRTEIDDQPSRHRWHNHPRRGARTDADNDPPRLSPQGVRLRELLTALTARLGPYPHRAIELAGGTLGGEGRRKNNKAMRYKCPECPWTVRIGPVSLEFGTPICPNPECENYYGDCIERKDRSRK